MMYELRIYHCVPGKLPELHQRFEGATLKLFAKHGIRPVGFWTVLVGGSNQDLYYLLEWKDMAEREQRWNAFAADPEWIAKRAESEKNGPLLASIDSSFLAPTSYSAMK